MERPEQPEDLTEQLRRLDAQHERKRTPAQTRAEERAAQHEARRGAMLVRVVAQLEQDAAGFAEYMGECGATPDMDMVVGHRPQAPVKPRWGRRAEPQAPIPVYDKVWVASAYTQIVTETKPGGSSYGASSEATTRFRGLAINGAGRLLTYAGVPRVSHSAHEGTARTTASSTHETEWEHTDVSNIVGPLVPADVPPAGIILPYDIDPAFELPSQRVFLNFRERLTAIRAQGR